MRRRRTQERSVPKPVFTDAEAGAKNSRTPTARRFNYYTPAKRKQSHYEDVTVEVQPDPRHYLSQGWLYGFSDGRGGYPLDWTVLKAWGSDRPEPERYPGSGGKGYDWPAHGWHEFRDPNEEWELTLYRYNANVVRQLNQNIDDRQAGEGVRAVEPELGPVRRAQRRRVDARGSRPRPLPVRQRQPARADQHAQQRDLGEQHAPDQGGAGPRALQPDPDRGDQRLRRRRAHETWNDDPAWQGVREIAEQLTGIDDWCEAIFAANVVFEPLVGELFRSHLVQHAAPRNGDFVTPTVVGAEEYDFAERDLRYTIAMFQLLTHDREFADHNKGLLQQLAGCLGAARIAAARTLQPLWSQPDAKPPRFEDGLDAAKNRFAGILSDLDLEAPKELASDPRSRPRKARTSPTTPRPTCAASP